jgi:hypothetical protein
MAAFAINASRARGLIPSDEIHPLRLWKSGVLMITVVNYLDTVIGTYIEFSIALACTHGQRPAPRFLPLLLMSYYDVGQYVYDLPVSTEISTKGGKGIWGMPKHQANLDFVVGPSIISSQYDLDGKLAMRVDIKRPTQTWLPMSLKAVNFCQFRGMLMKSLIYFSGKMGVSAFQRGAARLTIGDHPRLASLKELDIGDCLFTSWLPDTDGVLDDHYEGWFVTHGTPPSGVRMEGMESVVNLGLGQEWLSPPQASGRTTHVQQILEGQTAL